MFILRSRGTSLRSEICVVGCRSYTFIKFDRNGDPGNDHERNPESPQPAAIRRKLREPHAMFNRFKIASAIQRESWIYRCRDRSFFSPLIKIAECRTRYSSSPGNSPIRTTGRPRIDTDFPAVRRSTFIKASPKSQTDRRLNFSYQRMKNDTRTLF